MFRGAIRRGAGSGLIRWPASGHDMVSSRSCGSVDITHLLVHPATRWRVSLMVRVVTSLKGPNGQGARDGLEGDATASGIKFETCRTREGSQPRPGRLGHRTQGHLTGTGWPRASVSFDTY
jgi:hypothetical protein